MGKKRPDGQEGPRKKVVKGGLAGLGNAFAEFQAQPAEDPSAESAKERRNRLQRERRAQEAEKKKAEANAANGTAGNGPSTDAAAEAAPGEPPAAERNENKDYSNPENNVGRVFNVTGSFVDSNGRLLAPVVLKNGQTPVDVTIVYPDFQVGDQVPENNQQIRITSYDRSEPVVYYGILESHKNDFVHEQAKALEVQDYLLPGDRVEGITLERNRKTDSRNPFVAYRNSEILGRPVREVFYIENLSSTPQASDPTAVNGQYTIEITRTINEKPPLRRGQRPLVEYRAMIVQRTIPGEAGNISAVQTYDAAVLRNQMHSRDDAAREAQINRLPNNTPLTDAMFFTRDKGAQLTRKEDQRDKANPFNAYLRRNEIINGKDAVVAIRPLIRLYENADMRQQAQTVSQLNFAVVGKLDRRLESRVSYEGVFQHDVRFLKGVALYESLLQQHEGQLRAVTERIGAILQKGDTANLSPEEQLIKRVFGKRNRVIFSLQELGRGFADLNALEKSLTAFTTAVKDLGAAVNGLPPLSSDAAVTAQSYEQDIFLFELEQFEKTHPTDFALAHERRRKIYESDVLPRIDSTQKFREWNDVQADLDKITFSNQADKHGQVRGILEWAHAYLKRYPELGNLSFGPKQAVSAPEVTGSSTPAAPVVAEPSAQPEDTTVTAPIAQPEAAQADPATPPASAEPVPTPAPEAKRPADPFVLNADIDSDDTAAPQPSLDLQDTTAFDAQPQPAARSGETPAVEAEKKQEEPPKASPLERFFRRMGLPAGFAVDKALALGKITVGLTTLFSYGGGPGRPDIYPAGLDIHSIEYNPEKPDSEAMVYMTERYAAVGGGFAPGGKKVIRPLSLLEKFGPFRLLESTPIPAEKPAVQDKAKSAASPIPEELRVNGSPDDLKRWTTDMPAGSMAAYNEWVMPPTSFVAQEPAPAPAQSPVVDPEIDLYDPSVVSGDRAQFIRDAFPPRPADLDTTSFVKERRPARTTEPPTVTETSTMPPAPPPIQGGVDFATEPPRAEGVALPSTEISRLSAAKPEIIPTNDLITVLDQGHWGDSVPQIQAIQNEIKFIDDNWVASKQFSVDSLLYRLQQKGLISQEQRLNSTVKTKMLKLLSTFAEDPASGVRYVARNSRPQEGRYTFEIFS
jgi:hypothetical protein